MARRAPNWWLRSPVTHSTSSVWRVLSDGDYSSWYANVSYGVRPALMG